MSESQPFDFSQLPFEDNGAPTVSADFVHDVTLVGSIAVFTLCYVKQTAAGNWFKDCSFYARLPKEAVPPGLLLTARKLGMTNVIPIIGSAVRQAIWH